MCVSVLKVAKTLVVGPLMLLRAVFGNMAVLAVALGNGTVAVATVVVGLFKGLWPTVKFTATSAGAAGKQVGALTPPFMSQVVASQGSTCFEKGKKVPMFSML